MKSLKSVITQYFKLEQQINDAFKFKGDWRDYPLCDCRDMYWSVDHTAHRDELVYWDQPITFQNLDDGAYYSAEVIRDHIYEAAGFTLVIADTQCDNNIFAYILDDEKKCNIEEE